MKIFFSLLIFLATWLCSGQDNRQKQFDPVEFDSYVGQAVKDWNVPGLAVAVVSNDSVVFIKGYGVRELGKQEWVDKNTIFAIASTTKAFTAAAMGILVDEGKMGWNDPVVKHLPSFKLKDPNLTRLITIRDLLTHNAGLPNTDFLWLDPEISTKEMVKRLEHVEAAYNLRAGFVYQNLMYAVAGEVIEAVSGMPWDRFIQIRILDPLQMKRTFPLRRQSMGAGNIAKPHDYVKSQLEVIENSEADEIGPAGSMWSSVEDMSQWMRFLLRDCQTEAGEQLLEKNTCGELFKPQTVLPEPAYPTASLVKPHWNTYGLGWFQQDFEGRKVDFHTGSLSGMVAIAGMIKDEGIAVYVLGNRDHAELRHALMYRTFDLFDEDEPRDWSRDIKELYDNLANKQKAAINASDSIQTANRIIKTKASLPLDRYSGTYKEPLFGTVEISKEGNNLRLSFGRITGKLDHWHYDTFAMTNDKREQEGKVLVSFDLDSSGNPHRLNFRGVTFERVGEEAN